MKISEIVDKFDLRDSQLFFDFTQKWIYYVTSKKTSTQITTDEWSELFGRRNPVAGLDWAEMQDEVKVRNGQMRKTNEKKSIISNWDSSIRPFIEATISITDSSSKIAKIKDLEKLLHHTIKDGGGRNMVIAINRILITFFPDYLVRIPNNQYLKEFISLLNKHIENGSSIIVTNNWIDDCYQVKKFLDNELNDNNLTASAWWFYEHLKKSYTTGPTNTTSNQTQQNMNTNNIETFVNLLKGNYNLILTGAPGTGKTYLAKEIAKAMGAEYKLVQFHPSYDYTDFVEGLRPIKKGDSLGFERKDGVFKAFCKEAINFSTTVLFDNAYTALVEKIKTGSIKTLKLKTKDSAELEIRGEDSIGWYSKTEKNNKSTNVVSRDRLKKLFSVYNTLDKLEKLQNINDGVQSIIGGCDSTYYWGVLHYLLEFSQLQSKRYVFIIDEINRGEISKIFGELFYSIDAGYRGESGKVDTQYQNLIPKEGDADFDSSKADVFRNGFFIPENVYIIGTMNDIDRSVESMDFAMRRRFAWKEISAGSRQDMLDQVQAWGTYGKPTPEIISEIKVRMNNLNAAIIDQYGVEQLSNKDKVGFSKAYQIGAAYFLKYALYNNFDELWANHLEGLLYEYLRGKTNIEEKIERLHQAYNDTTQL